MEDKEKQPVDKYGFADAPASATVKIKSKNGFEYLFTMRDEKASNLMFKIDAMEKKWLALEWTPLSQNTRGGFAPKPVDYVPNRTCPQDAARLVYATKKDGSKFIKCENNKWDKMQNRVIGCPFIEWPKPQVPVRQIDEESNP